MNTTIEALKTLYVQMGGNADTVANVTIIPDMIAELTRIATPFISAADNGKVVVDGALTAQTAMTVTENNTYDTTTKNSVTVNVSGGAAVEVASDSSGVISLADTDFQTPPQVISDGSLTRLTVIVYGGDFEFAYSDYGGGGQETQTVSVDSDVAVVPGMGPVAVLDSEEGPTILYDYDEVSEEFSLDCTDTTPDTTLDTATPTTFAAKLYQIEL